MNQIEELEQTLNQLKKAVDEQINNVPAAEIEAYNLNFAANETKNALQMSKLRITTEEVSALMKGYKVHVDEITKRNAFNHFRAFNKVVEAANNKLVLNEIFVKDLHELLLDGIIPGGMYRNVDISVNGSQHTPPSYLKVYDRMGRFYYDLENMANTPLDAIAYAHLQFSKIHPFLDGNVRMAALIMNYELFYFGYCPVIIPFKRQKEYYECLEAFKVEKNAAPFRTFLLSLLFKEYQNRLALIEHYALAEKEVAA